MQGRRRRSQWQPLWTLGSSFSSTSEVNSSSESKWQPAAYLFLLRAAARAFAAAVSTFAFLILALPCFAATWRLPTSGIRARTGCSFWRLDAETLHDPTPRACTTTDAQAGEYSPA